MILIFILINSKLFNCQLFFAITIFYIFIEEKKKFNVNL